MSNIDRQRITAVQTLEAMGFRFTAGEWQPPGSPPPANMSEADTMHAILVQRADALDGCMEWSDEAAELAAVTAAIEAYEARRWPEGKEPGGKG
jgi:hypothetical protein